MTYVMSDLHGEYEKYLAMLKKINFCDEDILYVLGDVVDRGDKPVELLRDMSLRFNVYPIMGNHEYMAVNVLRKLMLEITDESISRLDADTMRGLLEWQENGAESTIKGFAALSRDDREFLLDYMADFAPYEVAEAGDKVFILVHAGLGNFDREKELDEYSVYDLAFTRFDYDRQYFNDKVYIVTGHTPTLSLTGKPEIYRSGRNLSIDCGASYEGGRLACLCLETMEEFYI